jgi:flagellar protein FliS
MDQRLRNFYLESRINNATPGELLVMLYDGLIEHAEYADQEITEPSNPADPSAAAREVSRCIDILTELNTALNHSVDAKLCATLSDLYLFFTRQLSEALDVRAPKKIRDILPLIRDLRKTWAEADRRANQFQPGTVAVAS